MEASGSFSYVFLSILFRNSMGNAIGGPGSFSFDFPLISLRKTIGNSLGSLRLILLCFF